MKGWVYIITTKSMPHLVKVGFSTKDPELRAAELNNTGNPYPYEVAYDVLVNEPRDVEQIAHGLLKDKGVHENKEWFKCSIEIAVEAIKKASSGDIILENIQFNSSSIAFAESVISKPVSKFILQDGIATDTETGLMWLRFAYGQKWEDGDTVGNAEKMDWSRAMQTAKTFNKKGGYGGFLKWRVPDIEELQTLVNNIKDEKIDIFPKNPGDFWSSSADASSSSHNSTHAWNIYFGYGDSYRSNKNGSNYVRLVR